MGKKSKKSVNSGNDDDWLWVDPERILFQHSKIRPFFSGCGRSVTDTLDSIRKKDLSPLDLPPIQVIVGPTTEETDGPWYFSLNNRRLWVLKRAREENLLENNLIRVRVRDFKSQSERERYTVDKCVLEAKFMREKKKNDNCNNINESGISKEMIHCDSQTNTAATPNADVNSTEKNNTSKDSGDSKGTDSSDSDSDDEIHGSYENPFNVLI